MTYDRTIRILRDGKALLRHTRQRASLEQKFLDLWRGQHVYVQIVGARRPLGTKEQPWNIMSDVREAVEVTDGSLMDRDLVAPVTSTQSRWVRPRRPWILAP